MKYFITLLLLVSIVSCNEDDSDDSKNLGQSEADIIEYIENNNLDASRSSNGVYYLIDEAGEGDFPTEDAYVKVSYEGYLLDGSIFDSNSDGVSFDLLSVIPGFSEGLSFFNTGSSGTILIPPSLAYGDSGAGSSIPGGAVVIFDVEVISIMNPQSEDDIIAYLDTNDIEAERTDSGLYYNIETPGEGDPITINSTVTVIYKGYFTNGVEFDNSNDVGVQFNLSNVIPGFAEGIALFKEGGKGTIFLPPNLAYGSEGTTGIPRSAVLIFDIEVESLD
ncbi:FKBP-type peptidyl-prolyl cis-trans isomerase [Lutibacter holmesii]|uniref:Peptidyl-prolyl cis-trans isomerase n=1 Tax=Lutibacter holmesii TaxID=1137985 RepID=A0ABW3WQE2_9FLAO